MATRDEEQKAIKAANKEKLVEGETWAVIDAKWFAAWLAYAGMTPRFEIVPDARESAKPGPIDNSALEDPQNPGVLKDEVVEQRDFNLVHVDTWNLWHSWFGGGPAFLRTVSISAGEPRIELRPLILTLIECDPATGAPLPDTARQLQLSKLDKLEKIADLYRGPAAAAPEPGAPAEGKEGKEASLDSDDDPEAKEVDRGVRLWFQPKPDEDDKPEGKSASPAAAAGEEGGAADEGKAKPDPWQVFGALTYKQYVEAFLDDKRAVVLIEKKKEDGSWPRVVREWNDFRVGDIIDAQDTSRNWYWSTVEELKDDEVKVHYEGWSSRWDEWLPKNSVRLAAKGTYAYGGKGVSQTSFKGRWTMDWEGGGSSSSSSYRSSDSGKPPQRGVVGLRNLGNTCFMNSTLQCLSHTQPLSDFFAREGWTGQINRTNALGWKGRIADEYGAMVKELWSNQYTVVAPSKFKDVLGQFQPRFAGYQQQDSSELLSALLDGLHEDLNQVLQKPPTNTVESDGRADAEVAKEAWDTYQLRNRSHVVDIMQGQLKSTVTCPVCPRVSVTFDPFMLLSVPLPTENDQEVELNFVSANPAVPITRYNVTVPKNAYMSDVKKALAPLCGVPWRNMAVGDVWSSRIHRTMDEMLVSRIMANDKLFVYELPAEPVVEGDEGKEGGVPAFETYPVQLIQFRVEDSGYRRLKAFGVPLVISVSTEGATQGALVRAIRTALQPYNTRPEGQPAFKLRVLNRGGTNCYNCDYASSCEGCEIEEDEKPFLLKFDKYASSKTPDLSIGVEWLDADNYDSAKANPANYTLHASAKGGQEAGAGLNIYDCLSEFVKLETLEKDEAWYCNKCKEFREATKKFDLWKLPDVLIIHMKRFQYTKYYRDKITSFIDFPSEGLDLSKYCINPEHAGDVYDLYAVSNHMGSMGGGHYTAYAKHRDDGKWYLYDDSSTREVSESTIKSSDAYVLFYQRRQRAP